MYKAVAANKRNTAILIAVFVAIIGAIGWVFAYVYTDMSIFYFTLIFSAIYAFIQYFAASRLAVSMSGGVKIEQKDNPRLWHIIDTLCITTGLPMPEVYIINDPAPNAFATGRNPEHAIVAATTGLLDIMDDSELTAVMAHEMSHVKNYDIRVSMVAFGLASVIGLIADIFMRMTFFGGNRRSSNGGGLFGLLIGLVAVVVASVVSTMVKLAISRQREYLADSSAVLITRFPDGMVNALKKLETAGRPMQKQHTATEALFINNPLSKSLFSNIFSTHPPLESRIERIENNKARF
jgi:heat shock protein HtpX